MADEPFPRPSDHVASGPPRPDTAGHPSPPSQGIAPRNYLRSAAAPTPAPVRPAAPKENDSFREVVETIVFVVVLVLLLRSFVAEAFVIPTGSMATTLLGYHYDVTCPECGHRFPVNASREADNQEDKNEPIIGCTCPNCRFHFNPNPEGNVQP
jgi:hypothetical protein